MDNTPPNLRQQFAHLIRHKSLIPTLIYNNKRKKTPSIKKGSLMCGD